MILERDENGSTQGVKGLGWEARNGGFILTGIETGNGVVVSMGIAGTDSVCNAGGNCSGHRPYEEWRGTGGRDGGESWQRRGQRRYTRKEVGIVEVHMRTFTRALCSLSRQGLDEDVDAVQEIIHLVLVVLIRQSGSSERFL
jgi:hypothetical protein